MAFIRWRGNSAELLTTVYDQGRSRQLRLVCLGGAFYVEPHIRAAVTERFPTIHIDWDAVDVALAVGPPQEQAQRAAAGTPNDRLEWLHMERRLHYWAALIESQRPREAQGLHNAATVLHQWREAKPYFRMAEPPPGWDATGDQDEATSSAGNAPFLGTDQLPGGDT